MHDMFFLCKSTFPTYSFGNLVFCLSVFSFFVCFVLSVYVFSFFVSFVLSGHVFNFLSASYWMCMCWVFIECLCNECLLSVYITSVYWGFMCWVFIECLCNKCLLSVYVLSVYWVFMCWVFIESLCDHVLCNFVLTLQKPFVRTIFVTCKNHPYKN